MNASFRRMMATTAMLAAASSAFATTIAHWNFEDGVAGQEFTPIGNPNGSGGSVDTANGILMRGWNNEYGPAWTANTSNGVGLAMDLEINNPPNITSDGFVTEGALHGWSPVQWTIETHLLIEDIPGWHTFIGRDGSTQSEPESDFYLSKNGVDDRFRINVDTVGGQRWILDGAPVGGVVASKWYGLAVKSDGALLSMWIDEGTGYQQVASLNISSQSVANNALPGSNLGWTFGRGWYNGGFVDHVHGKLDNVRFSDVALSPSELIPLSIIPEPSAAVLVLLASLFGSRSRR